MDAKGKYRSMPLAVQVVLWVVAVGVLTAGMYYSATYIYPDGQSLDLLGFAALWAREILVLVLVLVGLLAAIVTWLIRRLRARDENAL
jgi:hypothetical protein